MAEDQETKAAADDHQHGEQCNHHEEKGAEEAAEKEASKISGIRKWFLNKDGNTLLEKLEGKGKNAEEITEALKKEGFWKTTHKGKLAAVVAVPAAIGYMLTRKRKEPNPPEASYVDQISQQRDAEALAASQYGAADDFGAGVDRESLGQWTDRANAEQAAESADVYRA